MSNTTTGYNESVCAKLEWNYPFLFFSALLMCFAILAVSFSVMIFKLLWRHGLFHANVRLMLLHFCVGNAMSGVYVFARAIYNICIIAFGFRRLVVGKVTCASLDALGLAPTIVACISVGGIGFERCVATCRNNKSDPDKSGFCLNAVTMSFWLLAVCNTAVLIVNTGFQTVSVDLCYCSAILTVSKELLFSNLPFYLCFEVSYLLCYLYVYVKNKRDLHLSINTAQHSLQDRYLKWNNIYLWKSFFANVISNSILFIIVGSLYYVVHPYYWTEQSIDSINALLALILLTSFVLILQPLLLLICNDKMKKVAIKENSAFRFLLKRFCKKRFDQLLSATSVQQHQYSKLLKIVDGNKKLGGAKNANGNFNIIQYQLNSTESQRILENIWEKNVRK